MILLNSAGARHERLLSRLATASPEELHPCAALAVRAAAFNEPIVAAQVAYYFHEWQAASAGFETAPLLAFLQHQPDAILTLSPILHADPQSPFLKDTRQQNQQHHG